ncbi:MAG: hypothetical protein HYS53_01815 [Candidatus Aenigmarchaeota archaeon]|nr:hypothetical protein [Candidatus Aenigmarchaeota archaeon]
MFVVGVLLLAVEPQYAYLLLAFFIASVFPDMDSRNSTVRKAASTVIPAVLSFFVVFSLGPDFLTKAFAGLVTLFASYFLINALPLSHRGKKSLHRRPVMLVFSLFLGSGIWIASKAQDLWPLVAASLLGYAVHMITDKLFNKN